MGILALNAGSSSLKFSLYPVDREAEGCIGSAGLQGALEGLQPGGQPVLHWQQGQDSPQSIELEGDAETSFELALNHLGEWAQADGQSLRAVAHRIVHGGEHHWQAARVDSPLLSELEALIPLAPLHQPHNLLALRRAWAVFPAVPHVACFDTSFHASIPAYDSSYALPAKWRTAGIRRYGFHGLSYAWLMQRLGHLSSRASGRVLLAHLGNGASVCAVHKGLSIATSMGFSALDGLVMGSRCGNLDPGVVLYLLAHGLDAAALEDLLYKHSGLYGLSGISADMRTLRASTEASAQQAISVFTYRLQRELGSLLAALEGVDALLFTGGIGEHDARLRQDIGDRLVWCGVRIDPELNFAMSTGERCISSPESSAEVWVIPTDEGRMAAQEAWKLLS